MKKGRGNYIGLRRWDEHLQEAHVDEDLVEWVNSTEAGDLSELEFVPPAEVWTEINSDSDDCLRHRCPRYSACFYFEAKRNAEKADIIVVNHALLLADAASFGNILPKYDLLIIDEAHHFADIARDAFSVGITNRGLKVLCSKAYKQVGAPSQIIRDIEVEGRELFQRLSDRFIAQKSRLREPIEDVQFLRSGLEVLKKWLEGQEF